MKYIALAIILASQAFAQKAVWLHSAVMVGSVNKGAGTDECWGEIAVRNTGPRAVTLTVTARRYNGKRFLSTSYTVAAGEKYTFRIEDPDITIDVPDNFAGKPIPAEFYSTVLVEPVPPGITIEAQQLEVFGEKKLKTTTIEGKIFRLRRREVLQEKPEDHTFHASNIGDRPGTVLVCKGTDMRLGCNSPSKRITVPPYQDVSIPLSVAAPGYLFVTKSKDVIVGVYRNVSGAISTFQVNSDITFGTPVPKKN